MDCYVSSVYCCSQTVTKELVMSTTATNFSEDRCVGARKAENCNATPRGIKGNVAFRGRCERKSCAAALPSIVAVIMCVSISCVVEGNQMPLICSYSCFLFLFCRIMKPEMMKQLIACCGLDCESCDARIATVRDDNELREKTAQLWSKLNNIPEITVRYH